MRRNLSPRVLCGCLLALLFVWNAPALMAQDEQEETQVDHVHLFEQGQDAHEKGDLAKALEFYDQAIAAHADFPEAEFQRASALVSLNRAAEAEKSLRHAIELRSDWSPPYAALGSLLLGSGKLAEAETALEQALKLDPRNYPALTALVELRLRGKPTAETLQPLLQLLRSATTGMKLPASVWAARAAVERTTGNRIEAQTSLDRALATDPHNVNALLVRAELRAEASDFDRAVDDALAAQKLAPKRSSVAIVLARVYARAGRSEEALRALDGLDDIAKNSPEAAEIRAALVRCDGSPESVAVLEKSLATDPRNPALLACLGAAFRRSDPKRSLEYYAQAAEIEPDNIDHAIGFAGALVQARRFEDAVTVLRRILVRAPDNYTAHASLATALYELKRYPESLAEFDWVIERKPDLAVAYFFIATANDASGKYLQALAAYEKFLQLADASTNQLEIDKTNLRLPPLRRQISRGEGTTKH
ncbi:MAG: tetratricopeptide repeat protein [Pyrinomonadaceae bacterium]